MTIHIPKYASRAVYSTTMTKPIFTRKRRAALERGKALSSSPDAIIAPHETGTGAPSQPVRQELSVDRPCWLAIITLRGTTRFFGKFDTDHDAERAYLHMAWEQGLLETGERPTSAHVARFEKVLGKLTCSFIEQLLYVQGGVEVYVPPAPKRIMPPSVVLIHDSWN